MKLRLAAACAIACAAFSTQAFAFNPINVTLATPAERPTRPIAGGRIFDCTGATCVARQSELTDLSVNTCKALARRVGEITAFSTTGGHALTEEQLAQCNSVVVARSTPPAGTQQAQR
jgi:hypothetical protein